MLPVDPHLFSQYTFRKATALPPEISVVIPLYNRPQAIVNCLEQLSLSEFSLNKTEVVIVDDASTDNSYEVLHRYTAMFPNIITLQRKINSGGASAPRNDGIRAASGKWILFVDSDDYITPRTIADALAVVKQDPHVDMVCMPFFKGEGSTRATSDSAFRSAQTLTGLSFEQTRLCNSLNAVGKLMRTTLIKKHCIDFPDNIRVREDNGFMMKFYSLCRNIAILGNQEKYYFVSDTDDVSLSRSGTPPADAVKLYLSAWQFIQALDEITPREKYTFLAIYLNRYADFIKRGTHAPLRFFTHTRDGLPDLLANPHLDENARGFINDLFAGKYALPQ